MSGDPGFGPPVVGGGTFDDSIFVVDQSRCIGCRACVQACEECGTHRGRSMIQLDDVDSGPAGTRQTAPTVCMHCTDPTCARVCPADAIKQNEDGVVQSALEPRCIGCSNCVIACPFGVPRMISEIDLMMKCDLCLDRTSVGGKPMCASVCPSDALWYGTPDEFAATRRGRLGSAFVFGNQRVTTKVQVVLDEPGPLDVLAGRDAPRAWLDDPFALEEPV
ncbi:MAG TPA: 4Fe-4S dicluster domain-containing protein [Acidimicrobiales bacterium]